MPSRARRGVLPRRSKGRCKGQGDVHSVFTCEGACLRDEPAHWRRTQHKLCVPFTVTFWEALSCHLLGQCPVHTLVQRCTSRTSNSGALLQFKLLSPATLALAPTPTPKSQAHSFAGLLTKNLPILRRLSTRLALRCSPLEETQDRAHARPSPGRSRWQSARGC